MVGKLGKLVGNWDGTNKKGRNMVEYGDLTEKHAVKIVEIWDWTEKNDDYCW